MRLSGQFQACMLFSEKILSAQKRKSNQNQPTKQKQAIKYNLMKLKFILEHRIPQKQFNKAEREDPVKLKLFHNFFKTQEMCKKTFRRSFIQYIMLLISIILSRCV